MKKIILFSCIVASLLVSCVDSKKIGNKTYELYGLVNPELKNDSIVYKVPISNVLCAVIFSETIIVPVYIVCYDLYEPAYKK